MDSVWKCHSSEFYLHLCGSTSVLWKTVFFHFKKLSISLISFLVFLDLKAVSSIPLPCHWWVSKRVSKSIQRKHNCHVCKCNIFSNRLMKVCRASLFIPELLLYVFPVSAGIGNLTLNLKLHMILIARLIIP